MTAVRAAAVADGSTLHSISLGKIFIFGKTLKMENWMFATFYFNIVDNHNLNGLVGLERPNVLLSKSWA